MKCPNCDGRGTVQEPIYNKSHTLIKNWKTIKCDVCGGCGEFDAFKPQTNEEWLRNASTEELAEFLAGIDNRDMFESLIPVADGMEDWLKWLQEKHT